MLFPMHSTFFSLSPPLPAVTCFFSFSLHLIFNSITQLDFQRHTHTHTQRTENSGSTLHINFKVFDPFLSFFVLNSVGRLPFYTFRFNEGAQIWLGCVLIFQLCCFFLNKFDIWVHLYLHGR